MGATKKPRKKYTPKPTPIYSEKRFLYTREDTRTMSLNLYLRLHELALGLGSHSDKTSIRIRLLAALALMQDCFVNTHEAKALEMRLVNGLEALMRHTTKDPDTKRHRIATEALNQVQDALFVSDLVVEQSELEEEVLAYKKAEDEVLIGADQFEYVILDEKVT